MNGTHQTMALAAIAANAIVWWVPFTLILLRAYRRRAVPVRPAHDHESLRRA